MLVFMKAPPYYMPADLSSFDKVEIQTHLKNALLHAIKSVKAVALPGDTQLLLVQICDHLISELDSAENVILQDILDQYATVDSQPETSSVARGIIILTPIFQKHGANLAMVASLSATAGFQEVKKGGLYDLLGDLGVEEDPTLPASAAYHLPEGFGGEQANESTADGAAILTCLQRIRGDVEATLKNGNSLILRGLRALCEDLVAKVRLGTVIEEKSINYLISKISTLEGYEKNPVVSGYIQEIKLVCNPLKAKEHIKSQLISLLSENLKQRAGQKDKNGITKEYLTMGGIFGGNSFTDEEKLVKLLIAITEIPALCTYPYVKHRNVLNFDNTCFVRK